MQILLTSNQVAEMFKVHPVTIRTWRTSGKGPAYIKCEGSVRYRIEDVDAWINENKVE